MPNQLDDLLRRFSDDALERAFAALHEPRLKERYQKTMDEVFDAPTLEAVQKLVSRGAIESLDYPVKTGKEGNVFHATTRAGGPAAVKIFRVHTSTFRAHLDYILGDHRFAGVKPTKREIVYAWARKEHRNLGEILAAGVDVPTPLAVERNVLVMEWIGDAPGTPAPMLKDVALEDPQDAHDRLAHAMERIYKDARLVHGDFSEYNVLVQAERLVVMDVGQAVPRTHPRALELLTRDTTNISRYFRRLGAEADAARLLERLQTTEEEE